MFKILEVSGSPYQRGYQHGKEMKEQVSSTLLFNKNKMEKLWKSPWDRIKESIKDYYTYLLRIIQSNFFRNILLIIGFPFFYYIPQ